MSILTLNDANDSITLTIDGTATTTEPTYSVNSKGTPGPQAVGSATGATVKTLVSGRADGIAPVESLTITNPDTVSHVVTLKFKRSATSRNLIKTTIPVDGSLVWNGEVCHVLNSAGGIMNTLNTTPSGIGAAAGTGVSAAEAGFANYHETTITITDLTQAVVNGTEFESTKIYDFPEGRILVLGCTANLQFGVTTDRTTTINDNADMDWAVGTAAASATALATTMVDLIPKQDKLLAGVADAYSTQQGAALAASAHFDGTTTPKDAYLNTSFPTTTDVDANGTLKISGTVKITWVNLGDY